MKGKHFKHLPYVICFSHLLYAVDNRCAEPHNAKMAMLILLNKNYKKLTKNAQPLLHVCSFSSTFLNILWCCAVFKSQYRVNMQGSRTHTSNHAQPHIFSWINQLIRNHSCTFKICGTGEEYHPPPTLQGQTDMNTKPFFTSMINHNTFVPFK